jgi:3-isopropylmalate/(R)-2-methylmalate dehydratase small subunit
MRAFTQHTGTAIIIDGANIDTDQIIPKQFLKRIERTGYENFLFYNPRYREDGSPNPAFPLNSSNGRSASVLIAGANFGCGSSREHAIWALMDYGFRAIIAPSFADIFASNAFQNGLLTITLPESTLQALRNCIAASTVITIDLETTAIVVNNSTTIHFTIDDFRRDCLLRGLDEIGRTLQYESQIAEYERARPIWCQLSLQH